MRILLRISFTTLFIFSCLPGRTQDTGYLSRPPIRIQKLQGIITLDGLSNEPAWQIIAPFPFITLEPVYKAPPGNKTELLVTYDDDNIYVAVRCYDSFPKKIVARNLIRDGWRGDDWVTFHIDAAGDKQNAVVFSVYPLGSRFDMSTANDAVEMGGSTFNGYFNMIWDAKTVINDKGWFLEMKIPFSILRFKIKDGNALMGISSTRTVMYKNEFHQFPAVPQNAFDPIMQPSIKQPVIFEGLQHHAAFYNITPSIITGWKQSQQLNNTTAKYQPQSKFVREASLDVKYAVTPTLTVDGTINTDFAQTEADQQQFNLSRFDIFFPERRFFFLEQAGYYDFSSGNYSQVFYSRRIGLQDGRIIPVAGGARLTGKIGTWDIGLLNMQTQGALINDSVHIPTENFGVLRLRHKVFNNNSYIGGIVTSRVNANTYNLAGGVDGIIRVKGNQYVTAAVAKTIDKTRQYDNFFTSGMMNLMYELRRTDKFYYKGVYNFIGKDYNPGAGFVARSNFHELLGVLSYGKFATNRTGPFRYTRWQLSADGYWNGSTTKLESWTTHAGWIGRTFTGVTYTADLNHQYEYLTDTLHFSEKLNVPPGSYHFADIQLYRKTPLSRTIKTEITLKTGKFFDGWRYSGILLAILSINKYLEFEGGYNVEYIRFQDRMSEQAIHILRLRAGVAANLHLSGNIQVQYNSAIDKVLINARIRYNFRDGHDIYFVVNETFNNARFKYTPVLPVVNEQQILLKYVYTFY